jgi:hypothetical protein
VGRHSLYFGLHLACHSREDAGSRDARRPKLVSRRRRINGIGASLELRLRGDDSFWVQPDYVAGTDPSCAVKMYVWDCLEVEAPHSQYFGYARSFARLLKTIPTATSISVPVKVGKNKKSHFGIDSMMSSGLEAAGG